MIYVTGDVHGIQAKWIRNIHPVLDKGDLLIVCGDFGIGFWDGPYMSEEMFYDFIEEQKYTVAFIDGNHEDITKLNRYPVAEWNGGKVHKIRENLVHLMRGEIYTIEKRKIFAFGGGYSVDRGTRIEGYSWWKEELPNEKEMKHAEQMLAAADYQVDCILTHTAPLSSLKELHAISSRKRKSLSEQEEPLNLFLESIMEKTFYRHWYFGHFHEDLELQHNLTCMISTVRELWSGTVVSEWKTYE